MAATLVDARPTEVTIKFLKKAPFSTTFYYLDSNNSPVDLTGYTASIQVMDAETGEVDSVLSKTIPVVTGDLVLNGTTITGCSGITLEYTSAETDVLWSSGKYMCNLVASDSSAETFIYGTLTPTSLV